MKNKFKKMKAALQNGSKQGYSKDARMMQNLRQDKV